jgi:protein-S-isoprenylcysteine O-methyltransferase Ste14
MPARFRVAAAYLLALLVVFLSRADARSLALALPLALIGASIRVWAAGHLDKGRILATGGPYAHTRNPLYFGSAILGTAAGMASGSAAAAIAILIYFAAFYPAAISGETADMRAKFASEYPEWERAVPGFLPRLAPAGPRRTRFAWSRVAANREWRALLAVPLLAVVLLLRSRLL